MMIIGGIFSGSLTFNFFKIKFHFNHRESNRRESNRRGEPRRGEAPRREPTRDREENRRALRRGPWGDRDNRRTRGR